MTRTVAALLVIAAGMCLAQTQQPDVEAHLSRGAQLMQERLFEAAASDFEQALAVNPSDPRAHFQFAVCLLALGRNDEARSHFEQVRKLAGESPYVTYYLGRLDLLSNDYASAIQRLASVAEHPPSPDTAFYLGVAYLSSGDTAAGTIWLERAAQLAPRDYRVHYRLARAYSSAGREQDADREYGLYAQLRDAHKTIEKDVRDCAGALHAGPLAAAREVCHRVFDPNDPEKLTLLGQLFGDAGAFEDALDPLKRAAQLDPRSFDAWHNLGISYFRLQRYGEARAPLEKAVALRPDFYGSVVLLGATLYMLGDDDAALPILENAHRLNPADADTTAVLEKLRAGKGEKRQPSPIRFELKSIPFRLENSETPARNAPETMLGGVAVFDYNGDGRPDIFFTNGANIQTLKKDDRKYRNRLFRNDGNGVFTDVTDAAGLAGTGYDMAVAVGDYDNDGHPDLFVAGLHHGTLYHNNGDGTFTDVTVKSGLDAIINHPNPEYGPLWEIAAAWVDVNNDGLLDLFIVNYLQWTYSDKSPCGFEDKVDYCNPTFYKGTPNQLFLNNGDGTFRDASKEWGIWEHVGKGMGVSVADYDLDGRPDLFVTNDELYNSLFHNQGNKFEEVAFETGVAVAGNGRFISGMGTDFRDYNNDGYPDIVFSALTQETFPIFQNTGKGNFQEVTSPSGMWELSYLMDGFGAAFYDFDNDGWKDLFVSRGDVISLKRVGRPIDEYNTVFRNLGASGKFAAYTEEAGFDASPPARHRGCAFGDLDGDGRVDIVVSALDQPAEIWMNRSPNPGHWLDVALQGTKSNRDGIGARIKLVTKTGGAQYNHMTSSFCYASSSLGPVHFGLGQDDRAESIEIHWPSGIIQTLHDVAGDQILKVTEPAQ
jgi:Flp pilus assembly protein TadD